uniref:Uncharacterized protein n=1 Tax=Pelusios castaneus TaxID=367368 RepID=A0A8C8RYL0_9SAUR
MGPFSRALQICRYLHPWMWVWISIDPLLRMGAQCSSQSQLSSGFRRHAGLWLGSLSPQLPLIGSFPTWALPTFSFSYLQFACCAVNQRFHWPRKSLIDSTAHEPQTRKRKISASVAVV